jgi:hyperosmotically inducible periplasmic protein
MKIKPGISIIAIASLCGALPALAQKTSVNGDATTNYNNGSTNYISRDRDELQSRNPEHLGDLERAKNILGAEIKDSQDHRLAKVKDLAIDLQNGRIVEVIVATGGVLGMDEALVAVPPDQFTYDAADQKLQLRADRQQLKSAPTFKMSDWEENVRQPRVEEVYQYYSSKPYFTAADSAGSNSSRSPRQLGQVERASKLMGTTVRTAQDEKLGKIENLVVDLPAGRLVEVILASGGFLGMGDELSAIPPQAFRYGIHPDVLTLDTTKDALSQAPHFKSADWQNANNPDQVSTVYRTYNVEPYFGANAVDNTAQNVRDRDTNSVTPFDQGSSQSDVDTTRQIRQQVMAADGLSVDARNVKIITRDGRVTLRGPVASDQERQTIADIAAKVASGNVDNRLQVLSNPNSNPADTTTNLNK